MTHTLQSLLREYARLPDWLGDAPKSATARNRYGNHPLDTAAVRGILDEVALLLSHGADIHAQGEHQYTALHSAVEQGHIHVVEFLIEQGADLFSTTEDGMTPLELAEALEENIIAKTLCAHMKNQSP